MERNIFRFIFRYSRTEQIYLLIMTVVSFPFLYYSLDLPKTIVNEAIGGKGFPKSIAGYDLEQVPYLLTLCAVFLVLVLINGAFKYVINVYRGAVGERMLRRLRYQLYAQVLRFPLPYFRKTSQGELVAMITGETEPLGGFVGDSIALPAFQGGTLLTILVFMFVQDWKLGLAAVALYPLQMYLIPKLQRRVNYLRKDRTIKLRKLSERIGEVVTGIQEVHAHDTSQYELADYSNRMSEIYDFRFEVYKIKFFIKFLNNFIAQITPFFFFSIGGYLVIKGSLSFGALVAVLAAYKDLSAPWKEILDYYQTQADAQIKYELLVDMFEPPGMLDERIQAAEPGDVVLAGDVLGTNLDLRDEGEGESAFAGTASFRFPLGDRVLMVGDSASGKDRLLPMLAGLKKPVGGSLFVGGTALDKLPEAVTGRQIAYVGQEPRLTAGTVRDNLYYGLKHRPQREAEYPPSQAKARARWLREAKVSGNSTYDINADWIDYAAAGVSDAGGLADRAIEVLSLVDLDESVYQLGLQGSVSLEDRPTLVERILEARAALRDRLRAPDVARLVEPFDRDKYNLNMSVAENLLFGTPSDETFDPNNLGANAYVRKVLHEEGLMADFIDIGRKVAEIMVDLFADVEPGSELFEQFSFIGADDLPEFRALLGRIEQRPYEQLAEADRHRLMALPFRLVASRHRLGLIDEQMQTRLLKARATFASGFGEGRPAVEFFEPDKYNSRISIQDNILFGRVTYGRARGAVQVGNLIGEVVKKLGLRREIMEVGLDFPVGVGGSRLGTTQRQKLSLARSIIKRPRLLVLDEVGASLDESTETKVMKSLLSFAETGLIWGAQHATLENVFDRILMLDKGRVVQKG